MIKEKHIVNKVYGNHQLARYIDVYEVTTDGCSSSPMSGNLYTTATAYADSINKITEMYWRSTGSRGQQCISNIKIGGTTSISDALNY